MIKGFDFRWKGKERGWIVNTPFYMNNFELVRACKYVERVQAQRLRSLPLGDRRDDLTYAIGELRKCKVTQRIISEDGSGELNLFKANKIKEFAKRIFTFN